MKTLLSVSVLIFSGVVGVAQEHPEQPLEVVPAVNLVRYAGTWYEIARLPNRFQEQCAGDVKATYTLLDNGELRVVNRCRKESGEIDEAEGLARLASDDGPNTKLKVRFAPAFLSFLPFVWGDYWIIGLGENYEYAIVGTPDRKYGWILSRTPKLSQDKLNKINEILLEKKYDPKKFEFTQQD